VTSDHPAAVPPPSPAGYRERLWPAPWIWAFAAILGASAGLVASPFSGTVGWLIGLVTTLLLIAGLLAWTPSVGVDGEVLVAGRAQVPIRLTGAVTALDAAQLRHAHGPGLDARAYLCMRGWIPTGLRVDITDPQDPTPYWLISSRNPQRLVAAMDTARRHPV
jgi:hypothetical protein